MNRDFDPIPLSAAIVRQAFDDYQELRRNNIEERKTRDRGEYSMEELRVFFSSDWGRFLLMMTHNI